MAWHLAQRGLRFVVLEAADQLGSSWRGRWDSLRLFSPAQYDALPGMAFPAPADTYPGKEAVAEFLRDYATRFDLPVQLSKRVTALSRIGDEFEVRTADESLPRPAGAGGHRAVPDSLHAGGRPARLRRLSDADPQRRLPQPASPAARPGPGRRWRELRTADRRRAGATRPVDVSVGEKVPMLPQRLLGRDLFWWLTRLGFMRVNTATRLGRRLQARGEFVIGTNRRRLKRAGVRFRPRLVNAQGRTARFADGSSLDVSVVVWATGYRSDYSWISIPGVTANGRVMHRRGVTDIPGLYFLGLSWQYTRGSALLGFVADDAAYLAERIAAVEQATTPPAAAAGCIRPPSRARERCASLGRLAEGSPGRSSRSAWSKGRQPSGPPATGSKTSGRNAGCGASRCRWSHQNRGHAGHRGASSSWTAEHLAVHGRRGLVHVRDPRPPPAGRRGYVDCCLDGSDCSASTKVDTLPPRGLSSGLRLPAMSWPGDTVRRCGFRRSRSGRTLVVRAGRGFGFA